MKGLGLSVLFTSTLFVGTSSSRDLVKMSSIDAIDDPLRINLAQQLRLLSEELPQGSPHLSLLQNASSRPELLKQLSRLLATPGLSIRVAKLFKPLLLDLCARWLEEETELEEKLETSALLLEIHPEIFP